MILSTLTLSASNAWTLPDLCQKSGFFLQPHFLLQLPSMQDQPVLPKAQPFTQSGKKDTKPQPWQSQACRSPQDVHIWGAPGPCHSLPHASFTFFFGAPAPDVAVQSLFEFTLSVLFPGLLGPLPVHRDRELGLLLLLFLFRHLLLLRALARQPSDELHNVDQPVLVEVYFFPQGLHSLGSEPGVQQGQYPGELLGLDGAVAIDVPSTEGLDDGIDALGLQGLHVQVALGIHLPAGALLVQTPNLLRGGCSVTG
mmetsp:Transcript_14046/g.49458  ORF Transcript_14046/g.49458 Transcript_14046/m.49458 type:complete len:254 (+) Transcript_14046:150-911(+)